MMTGPQDVYAKTLTQRVEAAYKSSLQTIREHAFADAAVSPYDIHCGTVLALVESTINGLHRFEPSLLDMFTASLADLLARDLGESPRPENQTEFM